MERRDDRFALFVSPSAFRRQLRRLQRWGYQFVTFGTLAERVAAGTAAGCVAVTFDDGLADNLTMALPLLEEIGAVATVFVISGWLGARHSEAPLARMLTAEELVQLRGRGWEIGAHTRTHADLSKLDYDAARDELEGSRRELEAIVTAPVDTASYPFGRVGADTVRACRDAGFRAACRISGEGSWTDPFQLPRQDMDRGASVLGLRLKRAGRYEPLMRTAFGRALRRAGRIARAA